MNKTSKAPKQEVWVLTTEYNDYDQHGAYFEAVWGTKPTLQQLSSYFAKTNEFHYRTPMEALAWLMQLHENGSAEQHGTTYLLAAKELME